ncbi:MAG: cupin domain-containing protein [Bacteroidetes bacterium]|nr:cupin domain-containing protein [Bacteroidota bacterium]
MSKSYLCFMFPREDNGLHVHEEEDEAVYLISGELEVTIGEQTFMMRPGESYFVPRNVPHRVRNIGEEEAKTLLVYTPGRFGDFVPFSDVVMPYNGWSPIYKRPCHKRELETYSFFGVPKTVHLSGIETGNELSLFEAQMVTGCDSGLHVHANEDEAVYLLEGELELTIGDTLVTLKTGTSIFIPRNTPHRLRNKKVKTARMLLLNTPGTLDPFIKMAGVRMRNEDEKISAYPSPEQIGPIMLLCEEYDFHMLIPPC